MILLMLAAQISDPDSLIRLARERLSVPCEAGSCASVSTRHRIADDDPVEVTSKDRAIREDGSKCNVVGARRCPKRGRTIFRTAFGS